MTERNQSRLTLLLTPIRRREQQARQEFLLARQEAQALEAGIARCRGALAAQHEWARSAAAAGGATGLASYRQCVADLIGGLGRKIAALSAAGEKLQARRRELARWMKQRAAFEGLLRRQEAEAAAQVACQDTRELDHVHAARTAWRAEDEEGWQTQT